MLFSSYVGQYVLHYQKSPYAFIRVYEQKENMKKKELQKVDGSGADTGTGCICPICQ